MEQTLTYNRKDLISSFEKATGITSSVKIGSTEEAIQIVNHLLQSLEISDLHHVSEEFITPDFNKDTIRIRFTSKKDSLSHQQFISSIKTFNDYILSSK